MLPPFIIDQIRKREDSRQKEQKQPRVHLPVPPPAPRDEREGEDPQRGVVIIDLG